MRKLIKISIDAAILLVITASLQGAVTHIEIQGLEKTREHLINSLLLNSENQAFSNENWLREKNTLMDLDIFADVQIKVEESDQGERLTYNFTELPSFIAYPAMKRTDQDGFLMGPGITSTNLLGLGIHQDILARFTVLPEPMRAKEFTYYIKIPDGVLLPIETEAVLNIFDSYNALKLFNEQSLYSKIEFTRRLSKLTSLMLTGSTLTVREDPDSPVFTELDDNVEMFAGEGEWDFIPSTGAGLIIDTRDRSINTHRGIYSETGISVSGRKLGGDGDFYVIKEDLRIYVPAGKRHIIHANMLSRIRPGKIPAYELYHIGGVNSLRSFSPDPSICAQHEILATAEYRYELFTNRQISFFDMNGYYGLQLVAGTDHAWYLEPDASLHERKYLSSIFAGIHLLVPALERVRIEFGINGYNRKDQSIRFGINLGWYEKAYTQGRRVR